MKKLLFAAMLLAFGCASQSEELIILEGSIDSKVNGRLELARSGDKITGTFENTDENTRLELRGTINGEFLRLEEFAEKDKLTGIFDGKYDGEEYSGDWMSPNRKRKVPFFFSNREQSNPHEKPSPKGEENATQAIVKEYSKWAKHKNETEYCSPLRCYEVLEKGRNGGDIKEDDCGMRLEEEIDPKDILLGDINDDQKEDGIVTAAFAPCMDGTWFINVAAVGNLLVFVSNSDGGYDIYDEPEVIRKEIELGSVTAIDSRFILANGASMSGEASAHDFDISWKSKFKFENGRFFLVSSTNHVQRKDSE
jgi:hypothetical protein